MTDDEVRAAYRRVADPVGTPARWVFLVVSFAGIGTFGLFYLRGNVATVFPWVVLAGAAWYAFDSLRARSVARSADGPGMRARFRKAAKSFLSHAPGLPFRAFLWIGLSAWAWYALLTGRDFPLSKDQALTVFVGAIGLLLGARHLSVWNVEGQAVGGDPTAVGIEAEGA